jgi:hypothetical protein
MDSHVLLNRFLYGYRMFTIAMGVYGASRGYRATTSTRQRNGTVTRKVLLLGDRIMNSLGMGLYYSLPGVNLVELARLANRLDMKSRGLSPSEDPDQYREGQGYCMDTL